MWSDYDGGTMVTLVLWDIDETLLHVDQVLIDEAFTVAFEAVGGQPLRRLGALTGQTNRATARHTLDLHGLDSSDEAVDAFTERLESAFAARAAKLPAHGNAMPGAASALAMLHRHGDVIQSVLTGNARGIAIAKLEAFNLHRYVDTTIAAFGAEADDKSSLVRIAQHRATRRHHARFGTLNTTVIGDTPLDVIAGRTAGVRVVAVAAGDYDRATLTAAGAHVTLTDLRDTIAVTTAVLGRTTPARLPPNHHQR